MKKTIFLFMLFATIFGFSGLAEAGMMIPASDRAKENSEAPEHSPVIGQNWDLERVDFVHYAKPTSPAKPSKTSTCYKLMGVKWSTLPVNYAVNPTNSGLDENTVLTTINKSAGTWDAATTKYLFSNSASIDSTAQYGVQNYKNAIAFGDPGDDNIIAVTSVWSTRVGKRIVEFDMLFNANFIWGDAGLNPEIMDLENIATHELGHAVGLSDLYTTGCVGVTMYGYSTEGDIIKRTLEQPDITGLQIMYGL